MQCTRFHVGKYLSSVQMHKSVYVMHNSSYIKLEPQVNTS